MENEKTFLLPMMGSFLPKTPVIWVEIHPPVCRFRGWIFEKSTIWLDDVGSLP
jgi:hypothetical protein